MKILIISQLFFTKGGSEYLFRLIAKKIAENDHQVWVITHKTDEKKNHIHKNIKIIEVSPKIKYQGKLPNGIIENSKFLWNSIIAAKKIIKNENIEIIHSNSFISALAGSILSSLTKKPHFITIHDVMSVENKDFWNNWKQENKISNFKGWVSSKLEKFLIRLNYDAIHTVSEASKNDLLKLGIKKKIFSIPNSIEINSLNKLQDINIFQFVYVGRLVFYKNLETIFKAISIVKKIEPKIKLIIIGDGLRKNKLKEMVTQLDLEKQIIFYNNIDNEEKFKIISESNALIFPSIFEGFGLVILEAFSQCRPVLASNLSPMSDIISNKETGYLIEPYDEKKWAECILESINHFENMNEMGIKSRKLLEEEYNPEKMCKRILHMYNSAIK